MGQRCSLKVFLSMVELYFYSMFSFQTNNVSEFLFVKGACLNC